MRILLHRPRQLPGTGTFPPLSSFQSTSLRPADRRPSQMRFLQSRITLSTSSDVTSEAGFIRACTRTLNIVVERTVLVAVFFEESERVMVSKVLELDQTRLAIPSRKKT